NSRTEQVFGFSRDELVGQPTAVLFPDRARKLYRDRRAAAPLDPAPRSAPCAFEFLARRRDGTVFSAESIVSTVTTADGILVMAAVRDLTDRTRVEQQRSDLSAIVQASDDAIIGETLDGVVTSWNPGAQWLFGYAADEIVGRSIWVLVPPGREDEESAVLEALALGTTRRYETVRRRKNGMLVDVAVTSSPVRDTAGQVIGISKVASDITDRKRAEAALVHAKNAAEASSRELEAFSYSIAHDLRAPLRGMSGFAQLIMDAYREKLDATAQDWLGHIVANAQRMAALIDAMLSLSHVTQAAIRRARVDLATLARDVVGELAAAEPERAVELVIDGELCADLDPDLARALVENLIRNAWKFTSRVAAARIEVGIVPGTSDTFYVRDNGAGFDMASAGRLFTAFQRLHGLDEFEGTGIGLATVQRIVQRHGGQIWAEAAVDHGASFYFSFAPHTEESP
ncbi:MAG: PAS domain S-box protein, partial [Kofleriaceae bacterium]